MLVAPTEVAVYEGGADRAFFMIVLTSEPTSDVTITVSGMEPTAERSTAGTRTTAVSSRLDPQITITANRDTIFGSLEDLRLTVKRDAAGNRLVVTVKPGAGPGMAGRQIPRGDDPRG